MRLARSSLPVVAVQTWAPCPIHWSHAYSPTQAKLKSSRVPWAPGAGDHNKTASPLIASLVTACSARRCLSACLFGPGGSSSANRTGAIGLGCMHVLFALLHPPAQESQSICWKTLVLVARVQTCLFHIYNFLLSGRAGPRSTSKG
jgi:hypothetical protein